MTRKDRVIILRFCLVYFLRHIDNILIFFFFFFNVYLFILERQGERWRANRGGAEREEDRIPGRLPAISTEPDAGIKSINCEIMT